VQKSDVGDKETAGGFTTKVILEIQRDKGEGFCKAIPDRNFFMLRKNRFLR
jgi:hypothetical protein